MKKCSKCGKELNDNAKFCTNCGPGAELIVVGGAPAAGGSSCPKCGKPLKPGAKFCTSCGAKLDAGAPAAGGAAPAANGGEKKDFSLIGQYIHWNILEGQIAVKIDESDIAAYGKVKGLNIQDGVKALFFAEGKFIAELPAGNYAFKDLGADTISAPEPVKKEVPVEAKAAAPAQSKGILGRVGGFFSNILGHLTGRNRERAEAAGLTNRIGANVPAVSIVLVRDVKFPLLFNFEKINTASLQSDVAMHVLCKISNVNEFYKNQLLDKKFVCFEQFSKVIDPIAMNILNTSLSAVTPDAVGSNPTLNASVLAALKAAVAQVYPYIDITDIINLSAKREELEAMRKLREELYVSELELEQMSKRNEFMNRLKDETNAQAIREARTQVEFIAAMDKIDEQNMLNQEEREKFAMMLEAQKLLREAKNQDEMAAAMQKFEQSGMLREDEMAAFTTNMMAQRVLREAKSDDEVQATLQAYKRNGLIREEEIENMEHAIRQRAALRDLNDDQVLAMATIQNDQAQERQRMLWEFEMGTKRLENELQLRRAQDAYDDERRVKDAAFADERREKDLDFSNRAAMADMSLKQQDRLNKMEILRQAQAVREEREAAEHARAMAANQQNIDARLAEQRANLDAANEEKRIYAGMSFEQIMAANPNISPEAAKALAQKFNSDNKDELVAARQADQDKMMQMMQQQMAMMQQMAMAGMGAQAGFQQQMMAAKQAELDRTRADANANQDRFLAGMQTTIASVGGAMSAPQQGYQQMPPQGYAPQQGYQQMPPQGYAPQQVPPQQMPPQGYAPQQVPPQQYAQPAPAAAPVPPAAPAAAPAAPAPKAAGKVCPSCGAPVEDGAMFCEECGASL